ncbi:type-F conjugative transfer system protein TraW [Leisingera sp. ANG59]|uniref:type-F conjugative transfer system protein TraW n=1 Tax=Leisingera sp. ANG59 TaxID=2675221 RepID=UPI00157379AA|nr:type-F conjugative transfer system protein TraW [Leisingera sp. ANG59]NSY40681.1 type-F conjugative transfer system protein TraW [Leisingera sp. ANG59]
MTHHRRRLQAAVLVLAAAAGQGAAKDLGTHGPLFEVAEPSLLDTIKTRLLEMEAAGELDQMRQDMQDTTRAYVNRPRPVQGIGKAEEYAVWEVDMSITLKEDLADHQGRVFARAGTVVNPLAYSRFEKRIVLLDGDDPDQVAFALADGGELDTLLVLVNGDPLGLMREHGRRFYFDQDAVLVKRFGIRNVPAVVQRADPVMQVEEIALGKGGEVLQ